MKRRIFEAMFYCILLASFPQVAAAYDSVVCESTGGYKHCRANTRGDVEVFVDHQISRASCIEGKDWGVDPDGIWVDDGCRAKFEIRHYDRYSRYDHGSSYSSQRYDRDDRDRYGRHDEHHRHDHHKEGKRPKPEVKQPDTCPSGSRPGRCTDSQRKKGCKDWRTPTGLGCCTG